MKRVYADEKWHLRCHLCEYNCTFVNSGLFDMVKALKDKKIVKIDLLKKNPSLAIFFPKTYRKKLGGVI